MQRYRYYERLLGKPDDQIQVPELDEVVIASNTKATFAKLKEAQEEINKSLDDIGGTRLRSGDVGPPAPAVRRRHRRPQGGKYHEHVASMDPVAEAIETHGQLAEFIIRQDRQASGQVSVALGLASFRRS